MKNLLIGLFLVIAGITLGLYVGLYLCFIGGIVQIIEAIKANPVSSTEIAFGAGRMVISGIAGWLSAILLMVPGFVFIKNA